MSKHFITIKNKRYAYTIEPVGGDVVHVVCAAAGIDQDFDKSDIGELLEDLPTWIIDRQEEQKSSTILFRVQPGQRKEIEKRAIERGYTNISAYLRDLALNG